MGWGTAYGTNQIWFIGKDDSLQSTIVMKRQSICMKVEDYGPARNLTVGGSVGNFSAMKNITGSGCIKNGSLESFSVSAELAQSADVNVKCVVQFQEGFSAKYELTITPACTTIDLQGKAHLNLSDVGNLAVDGEIKLVTNCEEEWTEGDIQANISGGEIWDGGLECAGRLNWRFGNGPQWLQGRVRVAILFSGLKAGVEGGFWAGYNTPVTNMWVLSDEDNRFSLERTGLDRGNGVSGVYGYLKASASGDYGVVSGGYETFEGGGKFLTSDSPVRSRMGMHLWGSVLGGLFSASGWGSWELAYETPPPYSPPFFSGDIGLEGCVLWAFCASVDVSGTS